MENLDYEEYRNMQDACNDSEAAKRCGYYDGLRGRLQNLVSRNPEIQGVYYKSYREGKQKRIEIDVVCKTEGLTFTEMIVKSFDFYRDNH